MPLPDSLLENSYQYPHDPGDQPTVNHAFSLSSFERIAKSAVWASVFAFAPIGKAWYGRNEVAVGFHGHSMMAPGALVTGAYFKDLQLSPLLGRLLGPTDITAQRHVVVISQRMWATRFGYDQSIIGKAVTISGARYTLVGVAPFGFRGLVPADPVEFWAPLSATTPLPYWGESSKELPNPRWWGLAIAGRLRPGLGVSSATAEVQAVFDSTLRAMAGTITLRQSPRIKIESAKSGLDLSSGPVADSVGAFAWVVAFLLLVCWGDALLLLTRRAEQRSTEFATRLALGATRASLIRQLALESATVIGAGLASGLCLAAAGTRLLAAIEVRKLSRLGLVPPTIRLGPESILPIAVIISAAAIALVALPLRAANPREIGARLRNAGVETSPGAGVLARIGIAVLLAASTGLASGGVVLALSARRAAAASIGFDARSLLTFRATPNHHHQSPASLAQTYLAIQAKLDDQSWSREAASSLLLPGEQRGAMIEFRATSDARNLMAHINLVSPGFFQAMHIRVLAGRGIRPSDGIGAPHVAVVSKAFADRLYPGLDPLGRRLRLAARGPVTIVGVTANSIYESPVEAISGHPVAVMYLPFLQQPMFGGFTGVHFEFRSNVATAALAFQRLDALMDKSFPEVAVSDRKTENETLAAARSREQLAGDLGSVFMVIFVGLLAINAWGLAAILLFRRRREVSIRMALGSPRLRAAAAPLRPCIAPLVTGVCLGAPAAVWARLWAEQQYSVAASAVNLAVPASLALTICCTAAAILTPMLRASNAEPGPVLNDGNW